MTKVSLILTAAVAVLLAVCGNKNPQDSRPDPYVDPMPGLDTSLHVLTYNLYIGFDVEALLQPGTDYTDPVTVLGIGKGMYADFLASNAEERIAELAGSLAVLRPDVIGLQEVLYLQDRITGEETDFLDLLTAGITAAGGLEYKYAVQRLNHIHLDVAVDSLNDSLDIYFYEGNAVLYNPALELVRDSVFTFDTPFHFGYLDTVADINRGGVYVQLKNPRGSLLNVFTTHLEVIEFYRAAQAAEFLVRAGEFPGAGEPVFLTGDFNDVTGSTVISSFTDAGYLDVYAEKLSRGGQTCCIPITEQPGGYTQRIDYLFARSVTRIDTAAVCLNGSFTATDSAVYRVSDHAGVRAVVVYH